MSARAEELQHNQNERVLRLIEAMQHVLGERVVCVVVQRPDLGLGIIPRPRHEIAVCELLAHYDWHGTAVELAREGYRP